MKGRKLVSILGACALGLGSLGLNGCKEGKLLSFDLSNEKVEKLSNLIRFEIVEKETKTPFRVFDKDYGVCTTIYASDFRIGPNPRVELLSSSQEDLELFDRKNSSVYLVSSEPLNNFSEFYNPSKNFDLSVSESEKERVIAIAKKNSLLENAFSGKSVSAYVLPGSNQEFWTSNWGSSKGERTFYEGIGKLFGIEYIPSENGIRGFLLAELRFKKGDQTAQVNVVSEAAIAPPWKPEWQGYWDCPAHGKFVRFWKERIMSASSFSGGGDVYRDTFYDKKRSILYLDARNLKGERIKISEGNGETRMVYFGTDNIQPKGDPMVHISDDVALRKYR